jgi:hypothetical protein
VQPTLHAESGLAGPGHLGRGDLAAHVLQEPAEPPGGAAALVRCPHPQSRSIS